MTAGAGPKNRDLIPRWRSPLNTIAAGELDPDRAPAALTGAAIEELDRLTAVWEGEGSETSAVDLVSAALVLGAPSRAAGAAAHLVGSGSSLRLRSLPQALNHEPGEQRLVLPSGPTSFSAGEARRRIREYKRAVVRDPRHAIAWSELGRIYAARGQLRQAERAMTTAVALTRDSRYVLRSAVAFFVNVGDPERARAILNGATAIDSDPWLLAADLAVAQQIGRQSARTKRALRLLDADLPPRHLSELAAELGTVELRNGRDKQARRLFQAVLVDPTENAVAQVEWATEHTTGLHVPATTMNDPLASEARTRHALEAGNWETAAAEAQNWLNDQPFVSEAAVRGSFAAAVGMRDWALGQAIAIQGLQAHPREPTLLNNLAYALIEAGHLEDANAVLDVLDALRPDPEESIAITATRGLREYRGGNPVLGRELYEQAIRLARTIDQRGMEAMAAVMVAREEILAGSVDATAAVERAHRLAGKARNKAVSKWVDTVDALQRTGVPGRH